MPNTDHRLLITGTCGAELRVQFGGGICISYHSKKVPIFTFQTSFFRIS